MTLREQIKAIHKKSFTPEFHEYRQDLIPAMVNDLKMKYFDDLTFLQEQYGGLVWGLDDSLEIRAVKKASELISGIGLRAEEPEVKW
jgi:hypothetical protein